MTGSTALDIVIGLIFVYLLYSLFATLIQEIIATNLSLRAKVLEIAIIRMLNDDESNGGTKNVIGRIGSILKLLFKRKNNLLKDNSLAKHFYDNPLIKYLAQDSWHSKPSYLDKTNFSKVVVDLLRGNNPQPGQDFRPAIQKALDKGITELNGASLTTHVLQANSETLRYLKSLWADSQGDIEKFKSSLEQWFDHTMERASGWYKQYTQVVLLFVGLGLAASFNVDTLQILDKLSNNPKLTAQLVQQADNFTRAHPHFDQELNDLRLKDSASADKLMAHRDSLFAKSKEFLDRDIKNVNQLMGLGWEKLKQPTSCKLKASGWLWTGWRPKDSKHVGLTLLGWILTALAISLGAPFWFDLLNKLMKMRGSVASVSTNADRGVKTEKKKIIVEG
jgi:hypothetical protein